MLWEVALAPDCPVGGVSGSPKLFTGVGASGEQLLCAPHFVSRKFQRKAFGNKLSAPRPVESLNYGRPHLGHGEEELAFYLPRGYLVCFWGSSNISGFYLVLNLSLGKSCLR